MDTPDAFPEPLPGADGAVAPDLAAEDTPPRRLIRCRLCGRPLTGADSRRTGLGPSCDAKLHPAPPDIRTRRHEVEQDPLPGT
ncbi:DUF6011 domain-containing protein [Streptomyces cyaneofuscatus]|uniref:DUF6011 domain-containing protein n=1 Tax=Streptomyces cyaneofuscatus TaxID=66883 RepID=A0ABZ1EQJ7_9ACTN|nr:DUF6011 domain-containing protein [Streptomyces cyaneofuscatus]WSB06330.1 DUF6011 domain-containing protein [Streptomyces cyaneofuscatus]WSD50135.1 DUF6011 domain-containing protein [Streptomyces cyaneofuscatus]